MTEMSGITPDTGRAQHLRLAMGRKALTVIRQNLLFALVFNTTMILLASEGILSMAIGALCHQGSSFFVILNSMRLLLVTKRGRTPHGAITGQEEVRAMG